jgi:hypothetical protein
VCSVLRCQEGTKNTDMMRRRRSMDDAGYGTYGGRGREFSWVGPRVAAFFWILQERTKENPHQSAWLGKPKTKIRNPIINVSSK